MKLFKKLKIFYNIYFIIFYKMKWDELPDDIIKYIMFFRKFKTSGFKASTKIQSLWKCHRTRLLIGRYKMLRYLKEFRIWNPNI
tara:strand:+ start:2326 stop:2577 length:252 start_codon:yes stop_codon:yes gene_type:complete